MNHHNRGHYFRNRQPPFRNQKAMWEEDLSRSLEKLIKGFGIIAAIPIALILLIIVGIVFGAAGLIFRFLFSPFTIVSLLIVGGGVYLYSRYGGSSTKRKKIPRTLDQKLVFIAKSNNGRITPADLVANSKLSFKKAKKRLEDLVNQGFLDLNYDDNGTLYYELKDIEVHPRSFHLPDHLK